jgi:hypothetical protein
VIGAANFSTWWANLAAIIGAFGVLLGIWALVNRLRGRRLLERPRSVGVAELAVFALAPPLLPVIFGGELDDAAVVIAINLVLLGLIYLVASYGILWIILFWLGQLARQLGGTVRLLTRALPRLLLFVTFLFINAEVWQVTARLYGPLFVIVLLLFAGFGSLFALFRLPGEVDALGEFDSWATVETLCEGTPVVGRAAGLSGTPDHTSLRRPQWVNVGLVVLFGQVVQVVLVALLMGSILVAFGVVAISPSVIEGWTGAGVNELLRITLFAREVALTEELLRVSAFLAAFSGLYFAVNAVTDETYREEFFEDVIHDVRRAFAVRAVYLRDLEPAATVDG